MNNRERQAGERPPPTRLKSSAKLRVLFQMVKSAPVKMTHKGKKGGRSRKLRKSGNGKNKKREDPQWTSLLSSIVL
ncbi:hypothetical protein EVA_12514 [gut metagenome]|uniref:Uncharacterized protein n=1 Tax=gut metagenome TaxID=749906 RepID=J9FXU5_9ZZZZ